MSKGRVLQSLRSECWSFILGSCSQRHADIDDFHLVEVLILSSHDAAANFVLHWEALTGSYTAEGTRGGRSWAAIQVGSILILENAMDVGPG